MKWLFALFLVRAVLSSDPEENENNNITGLFEGDMILTPEQIYHAEHGEDVDSNRKRASIRNNLWPNGVLVYEFAAGTEQGAINAIKQGMDEWSTKTCIRFKQRTNEAGYVSIQSTQRYSCWSSVGRTGSKQLLNLGEGCWTRGVAAHELGHALGFYHEQSRPDRDTYVIINRGNIESGKEHNFLKYSRQIIDSLGTEYDYGSLMHYRGTAFSKNGQPTIVAKKPGVTLGQRVGLSAMDAWQAKLLYKCADCQPKTTSKKCCAIPFVYNGVTYNSCTSVDHNTAWCSLDYQYKERWGDCAPSCQPQTTSHQCCAIPFVYNGVTYNSCTSVDHNRAWCSQDYQYRERWGDCVPTCQPQTTEAKCCAIPFVYQGVTYNSCTSVDHDRVWCSLDSVFGGNWGNCE